MGKHTGASKSCRRADRLQRTRSSPRISWLPGLLATLTLALALPGCGDIGTDVQGAQAPIVVVSVDPAEGEQGQTLEVRIHGEGFANGDYATWERDGNPEVGVEVQGTRFVSPTELVATIAISIEAEVDEYDIAINRKNGIGTEIARAVSTRAFHVFPYDPEPLGWLGLWTGSNAYSVAFAVNHDGVIVGGGGNMAVTWSPEEGIRGFGPNSRGAHARGINNRGWIVGSGRDPEVAFVYEDGRVINLEPLPGNEAGLHNPTAINDAGTIVGWAASDEFFAARWPIVWERKTDGTYGTPDRLPALQGGHGQGWPNAINQSGEIVGELDEAAVLWRMGDDGSYGAPMVLDWLYAQARGINDAGWIVGNAVIDFTMTPVVWRPENGYRAQPLTIDEGTTGWARSINNRGEIVGRMVLGTHERHGVLWRVDGGGDVIDRVSLFPAPDYDVSEGLAVNDQGWIVGYGTHFGTQATGTTYQATLWRP